MPDSGLHTMLTLADRAIAAPLREDENRDIAGVRRGYWSGGGATAAPRRCAARSSSSYVP